MLRRALFSAFVGAAAFTVGMAATTVTSADEDGSSVIQDAAVMQALALGSCQGSCGGAGGRLSASDIRAQREADRQNPPYTPHEYGSPDLFMNYYVPPVGGGVGAQLYLAPQPVPAWVGHTYYTYQPLMPHEMLYHHHRNYHRYYNNGRGLNRTRVHWYNTPGSGIVDYVGYKLRIPR